MHIINKIKNNRTDYEVIFSLEGIFYFLCWLLFLFLHERMTMFFFLNHYEDKTRALHRSI